MRLKKKYLIIGVLLISAVLAGSACGKKGDNNQTQNTKTAAVSEISESEVESSSAKKEESKKNKMKVPVNLANHGDIDLEANPDIPVFSIQANLTFGYKDQADFQPLCFFDSMYVRKSEAESYNTEYTNVLSDVPEKMRRAKFLWNYFVSDERIYYMYSEQDFEVIADKSEKVTYNGVEFIREEGHIQVNPKDPSNTSYPSVTAAKYVAFYYTYNSLSEGMGMAVWGTAAGEAGEEGLNNYDLIKETADKSMSTLHNTGRIEDFS